jgi:pilus assembly protein CpaE
LRILLVSAHEDLRDEVGHALDRWTGDYRLYWVSQPGLALSRAEELVPQIILVDDDLVGVSATTVIRELSSRVPAAAILALEDADDVAKASQAVLAGARSFITKPLRPDELATILQQVLRQPRPVSMEMEETAALRGHVVAFCAPKGGTGRTTLAVNTAIGLRMMTKQEVALVDADYSAPAADVVMSLHNQRDISNLLSRASRLDQELVSSVLAKHASGVQVLLAPPPADLAGPISVPHVQQILMLLRRMFSWVLVDLGLPLDEMAFAFLDGADRIIVSILPEMVALRNTRLMLDQFYEWGYPRDKVWLVVNRATMKGGISTRDMEDRLHIRVSHRIPDDAALATHSINRGVPVIMNHRRSARGRSLRKLVQLMVDDLQGVAETKSSRVRRGKRRRAFASD